VFLENPLCKLLGIRYPIIQAGMAGQTTPELVAAVSNAGGLGILGATRMTPDKLLDAVRKIKMLTAKPYGVNLWLGPQEKSKKNQDISSVQEFLDKKFRKPLGLPLKSASLSEYDTNDLPTSISKLSEQLQIVLEERVPIASFAMGDPVKYVDQIHSTIPVLPIVFMNLVFVLYVRLLYLLCWTNQSNKRYAHIYPNSWLFQPYFDVKTWQILF